MGCVVEIKKSSTEQAQLEKAFEALTKLSEEHGVFVVAAMGLMTKDNTTGESTGDCGCTGVIIHGEISVAALVSAYEIIGNEIESVLTTIAEEEGESLNAISH